MFDGNLIGHSCLVHKFIVHKFIETPDHSFCRRGISREPLIAAVIQPCTKALNYIHSRHIIHRDIKSDNVMVGCDGIVKLIDFGVSAKVCRSVCASS